MVVLGFAAGRGGDDIRERSPTSTSQRKESTRERGKKFLSRLLNPDDASEESYASRRTRSDDEDDVVYVELPQQSRKRKKKKKRTPSEGTTKSSDDFATDKKHQIANESQQRDSGQGSIPSSSLPKPGLLRTGQTSPNHTRSSATKARDSERQNRTHRSSVESEESSSDDKAHHMRDYKKHNAEDKARHQAEARVGRTDDQRYDDNINSRLRKMSVQESDAIRYIYKSRAEVEPSTRPSPARTASRNYYEPSSRSSRRRKVDHGIPEIVDWERPRTFTQSSSSPADIRIPTEVRSPPQRSQTERPPTFTQSSSSPADIRVPSSLRSGPLPRPPFGLSRSATMPDKAGSEAGGSRRETRSYPRPSGLRNEAKGSPGRDAEILRGEELRKEASRKGTKVYHHLLGARNEAHGKTEPTESQKKECRPSYNASPPAYSPHNAFPQTTSHPDGISDLSEDLVDSWRRTSDENAGINFPDKSSEVREGPRSSKREAVQLSVRTPMPPETSQHVKGDKVVLIHRSNPTTRPLASIPESTEARFSPLVKESIFAMDSELHPEAFGWGREHLVLGPKDTDPLEVTNPLGHGSLAVVEEVRCSNGQFPTFVRKRVDLPISKRKAAAYLKIVQEEARILKSLVHPHIVSLIGSYEDKKQSRRPSYCLLMSPVGENDLETFLTIVGEHDIASEFSIRWRGCIRNWMACLASALKYMHDSGIRHQDIKPSNIIHKGDQVFFTDFSSSSSFKIGHATSTENPARSTPMYGAPEVTSNRGKHGRATDIFALGCVFSDMLSVVEGRTVHNFQDFLRNDGNLAEAETRTIRTALSYSEKVPLISEWFTDSLLFNECVSAMLHTDRAMRPAAVEVLQILLLHGCGSRGCTCSRNEALQLDIETMSVISVD